jgi:hypothetical protein
MNDLRDLKDLTIPSTNTPHPAASPSQEILLPIDCLQTLNIVMQQQVKIFLLH